MLASVSCEKKNSSEQGSEGDKGATTGYAEVKPEAGVPGNKVKWVQLWKDGPKWAEFNVGAKSVVEYGGSYCWGHTIDRDNGGRYYDGDEDIQGGEHDTAKNLWGDKWQMPKKKDLEDLRANCNYEWKENYNGSGKNGLLCTGKGDYSGNSIFLIAAGYNDDGRILFTESNGYYYCSTPFNQDNAYRLDFNPGSPDINENSRAYGHSVRAILK